MLRRKYDVGTDKVHTPSFNATAGKLRVAVHIRRGDIMATEQGGGGKEVQGHYGFRYTSNDDTLAYMRWVEKDLLTDQSKKVGPEDIVFHLYSEGVAQDFDSITQAFGQDRVFLHLDDYLPMAFHDMVSADVLIMAKSAVSQAVALLSRGTVYYQKYWHSSLSHWRHLPDHLPEA